MNTRREEPMIKRKNVWLLGLLVSLAFAASIYAQGEYRGRWAHLGEAHVDGHNDHDNIHVGSGDGKFRAVQLRVSGGAIDFQRVIVHFGDGSVQEVVFRERIQSGGRTRPLDLNGDRRRIESVEIWYSKESWHRKPRVDLYGIR
jgi:hypothetical protein